MPQQSTKRPLEWTLNERVFNLGGTQSVSKAAVPGVIHVCTAIIIGFANFTSAGSAATWQLLDGGISGTVLLQADIQVASLGSSAFGNSNSVFLTGLNIPATAGNALTLAMIMQSVNNVSGINLVGYDK